MAQQEELQSDTTETVGSDPDPDTYFATISTYDSMIFFYSLIF